MDANPFDDIWKGVFADDLDDEPFDQVYPQDFNEASFVAAERLKL
jgi:hypothetical protein